MYNQYYTFSIVPLTSYTRCQHYFIKRILGWDANIFLGWSMPVPMLKKTHKNMRYKANPSPPRNLPTSIGQMPGLWGGNVGCLMSQFDIIQIEPWNPPTSIGHMSGLLGGKNGLPGEISWAPGQKTIGERVKKIKKQVPPILRIECNACQG